MKLKRSGRMKYVCCLGTVLLLIFIYVLLWEPYCFFARAVHSSGIGDLDKAKMFSPKPILSSSRTKNLIVILTSQLSSQFVARLQRLDVNFLDNHTTQLLILHTNAPSDHKLHQLSHSIQRPVSVMNINEAFHLFPVGFDPCRTRSPYRRRGKWNYSQMIRFWFKLIFELPQLQEYEYIMRLDDDSQLTDKWMNVFDEMRRKEAVYFANSLDVDLEDQLPGTMRLKQTINDYLKQNRIEPKQAELLRDAFGDRSVRTYFNNFEVTKTEFFRRKTLRHWADEIDSSWGIFKYRWGDAILRYLTLAVFADRHEVLHRSNYNLSYCHKC